MTTGGKTRGKLAADSRRVRPGKFRRAKSQARGTPGITMSTRAALATLECIFGASAEEVIRQSQVISFNHIFMLMTIVFIMVLPLVLSLNNEIPK